MLRPEIRSLLSIARRAEVTGVGWRSLSRFYDLPADLRGLRLLDICAGMSDLAYRSREGGADAYALDIFYGDLRSLRLRHRENFAGIAKNVFHAHPHSEEARRIYVSYVAGFEEGLKSRPCPYVAGSATELPFPASSFDLLTSFNGIFGTLDWDRALLLAALREAIRVLKPGGSVQLVPYQDGPVLSEAERDNQREAVGTLAGVPGIEIREAVAREDPMLGGRVGRLTITKGRHEGY